MVSATLVAPGQTLVAPGHTTVIPLEPEFITPQDGHDKQDCEIAAARRWLTAHGRRYAPWQPIYLGDDLFSRQPRCEAVRATGGHFVFVCKPSSHPLIQEYLTGIAVPEVTQTLKRGRQRFTCRYRWLCEVPLRDSKDALLVNWLEIEIRNAAGAVTSMRPAPSPIATASSPICRSIAPTLPKWPPVVAPAGRSRTRPSETFNVRTTSGYHLEHNFGHGKDHLSTVLVSLNLLAFAFHTVCDIAEDLWRLAKTKLGARQPLFRNLTAITTYLIFSSWQELLQTLAFVRPPPQPP